MCDVLSYAYDYCIKINKGHVRTRNIKYFYSVFRNKKKRKSPTEITPNASVLYSCVRHQLMEPKKIFGTKKQNNLV